MIEKLISFVFPPRLGHIPERTGSLGYHQRLRNQHGEFAEHLDGGADGYGTLREWRNGAWRAIGDNEA
jgi:hypothetical protein